jgi:hypothetical protein
VSTSVIWVPELDSEVPLVMGCFPEVLFMNYWGCYIQVQYIGLNKVLQVQECLGKYIFVIYTP